MTDEQFAKLPKWAREEFQQIQRHAEDAEKRLAATVEAGPNMPAYGDYDEMRGKGLPCRRVCFPEHGVTVYASEDGVTIFGDGGLSIMPHVTNVVTVKSDNVNRAR